jgi:hypothetical protein
MAARSSSVVEDLSAEQMKFFRSTLLVALILLPSLASAQSYLHGPASNFVLRGRPTIYFPPSIERGTYTIPVMLNPPHNNDVVICTDDRTNINVITPPAGAGYIPVPNSYHCNNTFNNGASADSWYHVWKTGNATTLNFTVVNKFGDWDSISCQVWGGADPKAPIDQSLCTNTNSEANQYATANSVTTNFPNDMLLLMYADYNQDVPDACHDPNPLHAILLNQNSLAPIGQGSTETAGQCLYFFQLTKAAPTGTQHVKYPGFHTSVGTQIALKPLPRR